MLCGAETAFVLDGCDGAWGAGNSPTGFSHGFIPVSRLRQIRVGPKLRIVWRSVVNVGTLQVRYTWLPLRIARRSVGGFGSSSDGGSGGLVEAQPASRVASTSAKQGPKQSRKGFMQQSYEGNTVFLARLTSLVFTTSQLARHLAVVV